MSQKILVCSESVDNEIESLKRATGLPENEILNAALATFRILVAAKSQGRKITVAATSTHQPFEIVLPFTLKEEYKIPQL